MRRNISLDWETVRKHLFGQPQSLFECIRNTPFTRGLPPSDILQKAPTARVFKMAITCNEIFESSFKNENEESKKALENIWHNGWLHAEKSKYDVRYVFPTYIHRW